MNESTRLKRRRNALYTELAGVRESMRRAKNKHDALAVRIERLVMDITDIDAKLMNIELKAKCAAMTKNRLKRSTEAKRR